MRARPSHFLFVIAIFLATTLFACTTATPQPTIPDPTPSRTTANVSVGADTPTASGEGGSDQGEDGVRGTAQPQIISTRTPEPTATAGPLIQAISDTLDSAGINNVRILGIATTDWINLGISILIVALGYVVGTWMIRRALPRAFRRTPFAYDDDALEVAGPDVRWLVVLLALHIGTTRLTFVPAEAKTILTDGYFVLGLALVTRMGWRLLYFGERVASKRAAQQHRLDELQPLIVLLIRVGRLILVITCTTILLSHFGINITAFAAALGIGGLAISLAAQDTIRDAIAGFIILIDRPFRIGDRIEIKSVGTWGDVMEIGLRTTRIRTRDNRMVIVPNSIIGSNEVVNYTYPDPNYRIQTHVGVAYGTDIEHARQVMVDTVRQVPQILADRPVDALYIEMGDSAMIFRIRFWIESYVDTRRVIDRVHTALQGAMDAAGIQSPFPSQNLYVHLERDEPPSSWVASDGDESTAPDS
jgi:MscS family membrane protein